MNPTNPTGTTVKHLTFTGHRDRTADETALRDLLTAYPGATWEHGGAPGFDTQVDAFARKHGLRVRVTRPDYRRYPAHCAPLKRNDEMVSRADVVIALCDGRRTGGTYYTVQEATAAQARDGAEAEAGTEDHNGASRPEASDATEPVVRTRKNAEGATNGKVSG